jgi:hypothetical protein
MCLHSARHVNSVQAVRDNLAVDEPELRYCPLLLLANIERCLVEELEAAIPTKRISAWTETTWIGEGIAMGVEDPAPIRQAAGELAFEVRSVVGAEIIADKIDGLAALSRISDALVVIGRTAPEIDIVVVCQ